MLRRSPVWPNEAEWFVGLEDGTRCPAPLCPLDITLTHCPLPPFPSLQPLPPPPRGPPVQADGTRPLGSPSPSLALRLPHRFYPTSDQLHALTLNVRTAPTFPRGSLRDPPGPACVLTSPVHTAVSAGVRACQAFPAPGMFSTGAEMICRFYGSCSPPSQLVGLRKCRVKKDSEAESELSLKSRAGVRVRVIRTRAPFVPSFSSTENPHESAKRPKRNNTVKQN